MTCALGATEVCRTADGARSLMEAVGADQMAVLQKQGCRWGLVPWREQASAVRTETLLYCKVQRLPAWAGVTRSGFLSPTPLTLVGNGRAVPHTVGS